MDEEDEEEEEEEERALRQDLNGLCCLSQLKDRERKIMIKMIMMMKMEMMRKAERALRQDLNGLLQLSQYWSLPPSPPCWLKSPQQLHPNAIKM